MNRETTAPTAADRYARLAQHYRRRGNARRANAFGFHHDDDPPDPAA
jgi:hypothetical protein